MSLPMQDLDLYKILIKPLNTEKSNRMADKNNRITFQVANWSNKMQIKQAIEKLFNVTVEQVSTINVAGKIKMFRQRRGRKSDWKKAIVQIQKGQDINIAEFIK